MRSDLRPPNETAGSDGDGGQRRLLVEDKRE
jgi:hypothetical protein